MPRMPGLGLEFRLGLGLGVRVRARVRARVKARVKVSAYLAEDAGDRQLPHSVEQRA